MFGKNFYPTPKKIIKKMLEPYYKTSRDGEWQEYCLGDMSILEPSAGKGDILDFISEEIRNSEELYCIEINPELQYILKEKRYQMVDTDFLQYNGDFNYDLIIMNPPFSNGDEHILKAWDIILNGDIVCLLNAETIKNPYTERRKLLAKIIEENGTVEYLGDCFSDKAERKTAIDVALVRLTKETENPFDFKFEGRTKEDVPDLNEDNVKDKVMVNDIIGNLIIQFAETKNAFVEFLKCKARLEFYSNGLLSEHTRILDMANDSLKYVDKSNKAYNSFVNKIKKNAWTNVIYKTNISKFMTSGVYRNLDVFKDEQSNMDFTKENIFALFQFLLDNRGNIMKQAIVEVFDEFTKFHKENRCHVEGWKTNDSWKVNRKIILPYWVDWCKWGSPPDRFSVDYSYRNHMNDIDKVMGFLTGKGMNEIYTINEALEYKFQCLGYVDKGSFDNQCSSDFFNIRFYKKGTIHLTFKDKDLWERFNIEAARGKNWLPDNYGNGKSKEPEPEEKEIVIFEQNKLF